MSLDLVYIFFGSDKELKESQSSFVRLSIRRPSVVRPSSSSLSKALNLHLSSSDLQANFM